MQDFLGFKSFKLNNSVGNMMKNDEEDVVNTKNALHHLGFRDEPAQNGIIEQKTDTAIRDYQKAKGLKIDGVMKPSGETESSLVNDLANLWPFDENIDETEQRYKSIMNIGVRAGLDEASANLRHYLEATGSPAVISKEEMLKKPFVKSGLKENMSRITNSMGDSNSKVGRILSTLKDGESVGFHDDLFVEIS